MIKKNRKERRRAQGKCVCGHDLIDATVETNGKSKKGKFCIECEIFYPNKDIVVISTL